MHRDTELFTHIPDRPLWEAGRTLGKIDCGYRSSSSSLGTSHLAGGASFRRCPRLQYSLLPYVVILCMQSPCSIFTCWRVERGQESLAIAVYCVFVLFFNRIFIFYVFVSTLALDSVHELTAEVQPYNHLLKKERENREQKHNNTSHQGGSSNLNNVVFQ